MSIEKVDTREFVFAQKYRPRKIEDCILPAATKNMIRGMLDKGETTHMVFVGGPGMGKTTAALAIANELEADVMVINAALENGIDVLRTKIQSFASTMSLSDSDAPKIVVLDEADGLTPAIQGGLKAFLEQFSANCRFILTANIKHKIIDPILSRCTVVDFRIDGTEKAKVAAQFYRRVTQILDTESVTYDAKVVAKLVERNFPDFRKTLNELQRWSSGGNLDSEVLADHSGDSLRELIGYLKEANFTAARKWVGQNEDIDSAHLFRGIYDTAITQMQPKSLPALVLTLADYGYKSAFCVDQQVNTMACLVEIMSNCEWN